MVKHSLGFVYLVVIFLVLLYAMPCFQTSQCDTSEKSYLLSEMTANPQNNGFENVKAYSIKQVPNRKRVLTDVLSKVDRTDTYTDLYESLAPEVYCSGKIKVGTIGEGLRWTCNPWRVPQDSVLLSFGLNNNVGFEVNWQKMLSNRSVIYGFDPENQMFRTNHALSRIRGQSKKAVISSETDAAEDKYTMIDLAKEYNLTEIEILKIDIEGAEKECLIPFLQKFPVCQMYTQMHGKPAEHADLIQKIAALKYRLFWYEVKGDSRRTCQYSYINEECIDKYGVQPIANYLDFLN